MNKPGPFLSSSMMWQARPTTTLTTNSLLFNSVFIYLIYSEVKMDRSSVLNVAKSKPWYNGAMVEFSTKV